MVSQLISLGDANATDAAVAKIFIGGTALDISSSDVTFTAAVTGNSPAPAKVVVTGLNWTQDTDIIYDADGDATNTTNDQQTVKVTVSSSQPPTGISGAVYNNGELTISLGDANATDAAVAKIFIGGTALDISSSDVTFTAAVTGNSPAPAKVVVTGLNWTQDTDIIYDADGDATNTTNDQQTVKVTVSSSQPPTGISGAVYNNGELTISLGDANATDAAVAKIFIGGTALDISSSDVTFTAAVTGNSPAPAKVVVTGLNWTQDTDIIYDADGDATNTTNDQQTVKVTVSSSQPPTGISGAVYNNGELTISLGDANATDAAVAKIFIGGTALDISSSDVTFTAAVTGNSPAPAKVVVTGLNWTQDTDIIYDADGDATNTTNDQQTVKVTVSSSQPPTGISGAVYNNGELTISLGDANATDAAVAKIFIGGTALDISSSDVTFTAAVTGNSPAPAKVVVTGLN